MINVEFNDKINEMINRVKTKQTMFKAIYLTRGCGKEVFRKKLLYFVILSIKEYVKRDSNKIEIKWVKYNDR